MSENNEEFQNQIGHFLQAYLAPAMDAAADNGESVHIAVFSLLEMASVVLQREHPGNHFEEFKDYVGRFLQDYEKREMQRNKE